jgi:mono/diheme cytochrome c family protein
MRATKTWALGFVLTTTVALRETGNAQVPTGEPVAAQARSILQNRCFSCHGANEWGRVQDRGNVGSILDIDSLARRQLITPGTPDQSVLLQKVVRGEMPPRGGRVPEAEVAVLRQWIVGMRAPATVTLTRRTPVTDADIERAIQSDLLALPELDRAFVRYLSLHAVYNQCLGDPARTVELTRLRDAVTLLTNSLSWQRSLHTPAELLDGALVRIDLRRYHGNPTARGTTGHGDLVADRDAGGLRRRRLNLRPQGRDAANLEQRRHGVNTLTGLRRGFQHDPVKGRADFRGTGQGALLPGLGQAGEPQRLTFLGEHQGRLPLGGARGRQAALGDDAVGVEALVATEVLGSQAGLRPRLGKLALQFEQGRTLQPDQHLALLHDFAMRDAHRCDHGRQRRGDNLDL